MRFTTFTTLFSSVVKTVVKANSERPIYNSVVKPNPISVVIFALLLSGLACSMPDISFPTTATPTTFTTITTNTTLLSSPTPEFTTVTTPFTTLTTAVCTVKTGIPSGNLNLRENAGTQYKVVKILHEGDELSDLSENNHGWQRVMSGQIEGWVKSEYVVCE